MLKKKLIRDIIANKVQFISIFLMALLSTYIFVGMASVWYGLECMRNEYYEKSNYADYIMTSVAGFSDQDIDSLKQIKNVEEISTRFTIEECLDVGNNASITLHLVDDNKLSKCVSISGMNMNSEEDGIWLDYRYAKENKIKVGENILLKIGQLEVEKEINGLVINPEYIYQVNKDSIIPNHMEMGFAYAYKNCFYSDNNALEQLPNDILIKKKIDSKLTKEDIEKSVGDIGVIRGRTDILSHVMFNDAINQYKAIGIVFPLAFLAVTVLAMLTTMTRLVDKQRVQIGTLGTLGIKKNKIYRHYLAFGAIPSFLGSLVGFILGPLTLPYVYYKTLENLYTMEKWGPKLPIMSVVIVVLCVGLCVLVTYFAVRDILNEKPAQAIKPKVSKDLENIDVFSSKLLGKLGFSIKWNIVDMLKQKGRVAMTLVGILGCSGLLVAGFGNRDSLDKIIDLQYDKICLYESKMVLDMSAPEKLEENMTSIKKQYNGVEFIYEGQIEIRNNEKRKITNILVEDNIDNIKYFDTEIKEINISKNKINISRKLAETLGLKVNDKVEFRLMGTNAYKCLEIGNIYIAPVSQGITLSKEVYESLGYKCVPNYGLIKEKLNKSDKIEGVTNIILKEDLRKDYLTLRQTIDSLTILLMVCAVMLAIVVLYNLNVLSLYEKKNEFALLKVMGFKSAKIRNLLLLQIVFLTFVGLVLGIPFGWLLIKSVLESMGNTLDFIMYVKPLSYILGATLTMGLSIMMNMLFIFNIKNIDMVSSLKSE